MSTPHLRPTGAVRALGLALSLAVAAAPFGCATSRPKETPGTKASEGKALPFIEDDYPRALREARERNLPLFVDMWAPWCKTCRFMRSYVLADPALAPHAGKFVWLSIDTERDVNAPFLEKFPIDNWPTLLVLDSAGEEVILKWVGSANVAQLEKLFDDAAHALALKKSGQSGTDAADDALARADHLFGNHQSSEAAAAYAELLKRAPRDWPRRARAVESLMSALFTAKEHDKCAQTARREAPSLPRGPSFANASAFGLWCALELPGQPELAAALEPLVREAVALPGLLADDRAGLYEVLTVARGQAGDPEGQRKVALDWLDFLDAERTGAPSAEARAAFDPHLVTASLVAGTPVRALAALEASEKELPGDYNAPARLAIIYGELGRMDDALKACERALSRVYGPRRLRVMETQAGLLVKKGDTAGARKVLQQALGLSEQLPAGQRSPKTHERLKAQLAKLGP